MQPVSSKHSLFNNENLKRIDKGYLLGGCRERHRFHNKKLDKLASLVSYALSSAEKALKYVSVSSIEAEFAVKLFRSDRENLLAELQHLSAEDIGPVRMSSTNDAVGFKLTTVSNTEMHLVKNENAELKKELLMMEADNSKLKEQLSMLSMELKSIKSVIAADDRKERMKFRGKDKEIGNLLKEIHEIDEAKKLDRNKEVLLKHHLFLKEKELEKAKRLVRMLGSSSAIDRYFETVER